MHQTLGSLQVPATRSTHWQCEEPERGAHLPSVKGTTFQVAYLHWRNTTWVSGSHNNAQICKDIWVQKLLGFSKTQTSSSKSFIKHSAGLDSLAACNGEETISLFISVWAYSVHRLLNGTGPGALSLGEKKERSTMNRRNLVEIRRFIYIFNFWRTASMLGTIQKREPHQAFLISNYSSFRLSIY